jgi:FkbM family methyltransferase
MISFVPTHETLVPEARDLAFASFGPDVPTIIRNTLREGDVFIDVGAKNGVATTLIGSRAVGAAGRVIALEPDQGKFARLLQNVALNHVNNTMCFPVAASDETIHATLFCEIPRNPCADNGRSIRVQRIDALCARIGCQRIRLVKIDAPGSEQLVLRGMTRLLALDNGPSVLCHVSKWAPEAANEGRDNLINFMSDLGYVPKQFGPTLITRTPGCTPQVRFTLWFAKPDVAAPSSVH